MQVERVDFVSFLTQDIPRAKQFYSDVLGLEIETEGESDMEFRAGQVTLDIFDPSSVGQPFAPSPAGLALRVPVGILEPDLPADARLDRLAVEPDALRLELCPSRVDVCDS